MKYKIFGMLVILSITTLFATNVDFNLSEDNLKNGFALKNIEALASGEEDSRLWFRNDEDCVYTYSGSANKSISINIGGATINGRYDSNGKFTYTVSKGLTRCSAGGPEQCEARYCPVAILM